MSLVLPAPVNDQQEEILPVSTDQIPEQDLSLPESERLKVGLINPPPEIRGSLISPPSPSFSDCNLFS